MSIFKEKSPKEQAKELQVLRKKRLELEGKANLRESKWEEKEKIHKAKMRLHEHSIQNIKQFESRLKKAFLISQKGAKKLKKFMKEDHL